MSVLIDNADKTAAARHAVYRFGNIVQEQIGAHHGDKPAVLINGERTHNAALPRKEVCRHIRIMQFPRLDRAGVPQALPDRDRYDIPVFIKFACRMVIHQQHHALRQSDIAGIHIRVGIHAGHQFTKVADQPEFVFKGRVREIDPLFRQQLRADRAVFRLVGQRRFPEGVVLRIGKQFAGIIRHHIHDPHRIAEEVLGNIRLHLRALREIGVQYRRHGIFGNGGDGLLLRFIGIPHKVGQLSRLIQNHNGIRRHHQNNGDQDQIEYFLLYSADRDSSEFSHTLPYQPFSSVYSKADRFPVLFFVCRNHYTVSPHRTQAFVFCSRPKGGVPRPVSPGLAYLTLRVV